VGIGGISGLQQSGTGIMLAYIRAWMRDADDGRFAAAGIKNPS
jgi:hypothetical protein